MRMFSTGKSSADRTLRKPLGSWLVPWNQMRRDWAFLLDPSKDKLYHRTPAGFTQHDKIRIDFDKEPDQNIIEPNIPPTAIPVDAVNLQMTYTVKRGYHQSCAPSNQEEDPLESVFDHLPRLDPWEMQLLFNMELHCDEAELWSALTTQDCYIATDGSAPDGKGSFAWLISDSIGNTLVQCMGPVFGAGVTSFRAEGYGILSLLRFLLRLRQVHHPPLATAEQINPQEASAAPTTRDSLQERISQHSSQSAPYIPADPFQPPLLQHSLVCDNKSMVNKINEISTHTTIFPNATVSSELVGWLVKHPTRPRTRGLTSRVSATSVTVLKSRGPTMFEVLRGPLLYCYVFY
jgi:hypothetical protein